MKQAYYVPEVPAPVTPSAGKFKEIEMEPQVIKRRVSRDLYASPASGVREIIANEITAGLAAKQLGANPRIVVTVQPDTISVWGIDSLGMTWEIFDKIYTTLGRSSNFDGRKAGQFGLGRAAYTTITDHMLLETHHRAGDCYSVVGVEGVGYQTNMPKPDIPYGTRITMAPRDKNVDNIIKMVRAISARSPIPITLITGNRTEELERCPLVTPSHYITAKLKDVEFAISASRINRNYAATAYLCGMPIQFTYRGKYPLCNISLDINDERKYSPTPDRERMTEEAEVAISKMIDGEIDKRMAKFPKRFKSALAHPDRRLAAVLLRGDRRYDGFRRKVRIYGHKTKAEIGTIPGQPLLNCSSFLSHWINAVLVACPEAGFVSGAPELQSISDFMEEHSIRPLPVAGHSPEYGAKPRDTRVVLHTTNGSRRYEPEHVQTAFRGSKIYRVDGGAELNKYKPFVKSGWAFTIYDVPGAESFKAALAGARRSMFTTSRGRMSGAKILASGLRVYHTNRRSLVECWGDGLDTEPTILVHGDGGGAYALLHVLSSQAIRGKIALNGWNSYNVHAMETYIKLDNPVLKRLLKESYSARAPEFCDEFMRLDGKEHLPHMEGCNCGLCTVGR